MNIPSDDGVNVWQQCRTSVGHVTLAALSSYVLGNFDLARGLFANMGGPPDGRERDATWIGQGLIFHVAFSAALAVGGAAIGFSSTGFPGGYNYAFDQTPLVAGQVGGTMQAVARSPGVSPYVLNLTAGPVTFVYCFRVLPMLPVTA